MTGITNNTRGRMTEDNTRNMGEMTEETPSGMTADNSQTEGRYGRGQHPDRRKGQLRNHSAALVGRMTTNREHPDWGGMVRDSTQTRGPGWQG
jgi:hypothetical protein